MTTVWMELDNGFVFVRKALVVEPRIAGLMRNRTAKLAFGAWDFYFLFGLFVQMASVRQMQIGSRQILIECELRQTN
jgi:hypothetical protein